MPIEFRCTSCGKLLRTGDDTAGKQATCPACGTMVTIPSASSADTADDYRFGSAPPPAEPRTPPSATPPSATPPQSPFAPGAGPPAGGPVGGVDSQNPFQAPDEYGEGDGPYSPEGPYAEDRVSGPAIGLIVTGVLGIVMSVLGTISNLIVIAAAGQGPGPEEMPVFVSVFYVVMGIVGLAISIVIIIGAVKMKRLESYAFAMTASILAMIPCISPCCILGLPIGIWAVVVLSDGYVREAFRS